MVGSPELGQWGGRPTPAESQACDLAAGAGDPPLTWPMTCGFSDPFSVMLAIRAMGPFLSLFT